MSKYFPKPLKSYGENIKIRVDLSNYATKDDIKNITHVDTSGFALKTNLSNLKTEVGKLDIGKLKTVPVDISKLSNVVKNEVIKKTEYNKLVNKVNNIDTSDFVLKANYNTKITELENKIPNISSLVRKTNYNTKITELENKIPNIKNLATKTALTTIENKIPNISNLATNAALATVENKIPDISSLVKKSDYNTKITGVENNIRNLQAYGLSYFSGKKYFDEGDGKQNYLVFLPMRKYFKLNLVINVIDYVLSWQSKGISNENIQLPTASNYHQN